MCVHKFFWINWLNCVFLFTPSFLYVTLREKTCGKHLSPNFASPFMIMYNEKTRYLSLRCCYCAGMMAEHMVRCQCGLASLVTRWLKRL